MNICRCTLAAHILPPTHIYILLNTRFYMNLYLSLCVYVSSTSIPVYENYSITLFFSLKGKWGSSHLVSKMTVVKCKVYPKQTLTHTHSPSTPPLTPALMLKCNCWSPCRMKLGTALGVSEVQPLLKIMMREYELNQQLLLSQELEKSLARKTEQNTHTPIPSV